MEIDHKAEDNSSSNEDSNGDLNGVKVCVPPDMGMYMSLNNNISQPNITPTLQSNSEHEEGPFEEDEIVFCPYVHPSTPFHAKCVDYH